MRHPDLQTRATSPLSTGRCLRSPHGYRTRRRTTTLRALGATIGALALALTLGARDARAQRYHTGEAGAPSNTTETSAPATATPATTARPASSNQVLVSGVINRPGFHVTRVEG